MTKRRYDKHSTEFGLWLREQEEIDSGKGFVATNIDYMWHNYNTGEWMLLEEKRHKKTPEPWQKNLFKKIHKQARNDPQYKGFHLLKFENTSPEDGKMWLDGTLISKTELIAFLQFTEKEK